MMKPRSPRQLMPSGDRRCGVCGNWYRPRYMTDLGTPLEKPTGCPHCAVRREHDLPLKPKRRSS